MECTTCMSANILFCVCARQEIFNFFLIQGAGIPMLNLNSYNFRKISLFSEIGERRVNGHNWGA